MITPQETMLCQRRLIKEFNDISANPITNVKVACEESDRLNWYCLIHGLTEEGFVGGEYIFNIRLSPRYPFEPPDFFFLTPNGRFELNRKLCFSNSSYHKEAWSPIWTIKTIILGFLSFFMEKTSVGLGHLTTTVQAKAELALTSEAYNRDKLSTIRRMFP